MEGRAVQHAVPLDAAHKCLRTSEGTFLLQLEIGRGSYGRVFLARRTDSRKNSGSISPSTVQHHVQTGLAAQRFSSDVGNQSTGIVSQLAVGPSHDAARSMHQEVDVVAIKMMPRSAVTRHTLAEVANQLQQPHPNITTMHHVLPSRSHVYMVLEYANGGSLRQLLDSTPGHLPEPFIRSMFQQLLLAVDFCHKQGIAHRDIKLENLLLHYPQRQAQAPHQSQAALAASPPLTVAPQPFNTASAAASPEAAQCPQLKLADFGLSQLKGSKAGVSALGTYGYMAPEVLLAAAVPLQYNAQSADIWSLGVVLYALLFKSLPFGTSEPGNKEQTEALLKRMLSGGYSTSVNSRQVSASCLDLLNRLLQTVTHRRPSTEDVMRHPWFLEGLPLELQGLNGRLLAGVRQAQAGARLSSGDVAQGVQQQAVQSAAAAGAGEQQQQQQQQQQLQQAQQLQQVQQQVQQLQEQVQAQQQQLQAQQQLVQAQQQQAQQSGGARRSLGSATHPGQLAREQEQQQGRHVLLRDLFVGSSSRSSAAEASSPAQQKQQGQQGAPPAATAARLGAAQQQEQEQPPPLLPMPLACLPRAEAVPDATAALLPAAATAERAVTVQGWQHQHQHQHQQQGLLQATAATNTTAAATAATARPARSLARSSAPPAVAPAAATATATEALAAALRAVMLPDGKLEQVARWCEGAAAATAAQQIEQAPAGPMPPAPAQAASAPAPALAPAAPAAPMLPLQALPMQAVKAPPQATGAAAWPAPAPLHSPAPTRQGVAAQPAPAPAAFPSRPRVRNAASEPAQRGLSPSRYHLPNWPAPISTAAARPGNSAPTTPHSMVSPMLLPPALSPACSYKRFAAFAITPSGSASPPELPSQLVALPRPGHITPPRPPGHRAPARSALGLQPARPRGDGREPAVDVLVAAAVAATDAGATARAAVAALLTADAATRSSQGMGNAAGASVASFVNGM